MVVYAVIIHTGAYSDSRTYVYKVFDSFEKANKVKVQIEESLSNLPDFGSTPYSVMEPLVATIEDQHDLVLDKLYPSMVEIRLYEVE